MQAVIIWCSSLSRAITNPWSIWYSALEAWFIEACIFALVSSICAGVNRISFSGVIFTACPADSNVSAITFRAHRRMSLFKLLYVSMSLSTLSASFTAVPMRSLIHLRRSSSDFSAAVAGMTETKKTINANTFTRYLPSPRGFPGARARCCELWPGWVAGEPPLPMCRLFVFGGKPDTGSPWPMGSGGTLG